MQLAFPNLIVYHELGVVVSEEGLVNAHERGLAGHTLGLEGSHHEKLDEVLVRDFTHVDLSVDDAPHSDLKLIHHELLKDMLERVSYIGYLNKLFEDGEFCQFVTFLVN